MALPNGNVHPVADLFPMLDGEELKALANDIADNGLMYPIVLMPDGTLLDGRNRLLACDTANVDPTFTTYHGDDPISYVMSVNIQRRHLTVGQKAALASEVVEHYEKQAEQRMLAGKADPVADLQQGSTWERKAVSQAGKAVGVSGRAVAQFKRVAEKAPELAAKVKAGDIALDAADRTIKQEAAREVREAAAQEWRRELDEQQAMFADIKAKPGDDWQRRERTELGIIAFLRDSQRFVNTVTPDDITHAFDTGFDHMVTKFRAELAAVLATLSTYQKVVE